MEDITGIGGLIKEKIVRLRRIIVHKISAREISVGTVRRSGRNWKLLYTDASGVEQEVALGADGTVLTGTSTTGAPAFEAASGHAHANDHAQAHGPPQHTTGNAWKLVYQDASGDEQEIAVGADGTVLTGTAVDGAPEFGAADDHSHTSQGGITTVGALASGSITTGFTDIPVAEGGTGTSTLADHGVVLGSGTGAVTVVAPAAVASQTAGYQYLRSPSTSADAAYKEVMRAVNITIPNPEADDDFEVTFFFQAVTIREIETSIVGTSCTIDPYHNPARNGGGGATDILDAATAITAEDSYNIPGDGGTLNDNTVPADSHLMMKITAEDSCTELNVTFRFTID